MNRTGSLTIPRDTYPPPAPGIPLSRHIYAHVRALIVTGNIAPSEALHEPTIAERFGVSRTPVREALL
ncbi:MAG: GntR family transcriptional regulator, partial [Pseudomonadota bacterium]